MQRPQPLRRRNDDRHRHLPDLRPVARGRTSGLEQFLGRLGVSEEMINNLKTQMQNVDMEQYLNTAREYLNSRNEQGDHLREGESGEGGGGGRGAGAGSGVVD